MNAKRVWRESGSNVRSERNERLSRSLYRLSYGGTVQERVNTSEFKSHALCFPPPLPLILYSSLNTIDLEAVRRLKLCMQPRLMRALVLGHMRPASMASEAVS